MMLRQMINFKEIYYRVWVDAIDAAIKANKEGQNNWKSILLIIFSVSQGINLLTIFLFIKVFFDKKLEIFYNLDLFPGKMFDVFISAFITLFLPFIMINYYLVFYRNKYKLLMEKYHGYKTKGGLVFMLYFFASMLIFLLPVIIGKLMS